MTLPFRIPRPIVPERALSLLVYALICGGYVFGVSALVVVIATHVTVHDADTAVQSLYQFQIRTF